MNSSRYLLSLIVMLVSITVVDPAKAQVGSSGYVLPLDLAIDAARAAVKSCESSGYKVSVAVVDAAGNVKVQLKGDQSTVHTKDTSFRKAYTVVSMGPIFKTDTGTEFASYLRGNPNALAFLSIPNIITLPGSVAVKVKGDFVAGIGVGGAPGGDKDEVCAQAGLQAIIEKLPK
jgi:uncharacterized protein GlcG (DUF336 family)